MLTQEKKQEMLEDAQEMLVLNKEHMHDLKDMIYYYEKRHNISYKKRVEFTEVNPIPLSENIDIGYIMGLLEYINK